MACPWSCAGSGFDRVCHPDKNIEFLTRLNWLWNTGSMEEQKEPDIRAVVSESSKSSHKIIKYIAR